ncbi:putative minus-end-directed kinesin ATPase [Lupinus albus]|uniref:Putative minus-end-directed kinesin ATPase n=1 Tax=Lupinus albus TaxID=3870 RepID=A0A6A4P884_LUPAL|nr:putative minus-end-directed kinesin ATPase [Lupinus albus]
MRILVYRFEIKKSSEIKTYGEEIMSNITVCVRFRPLTSKEKPHSDDSVCIRCIDSETFIFKDEKDEESMFSFDKVFYEKSEQADVYQFLALPIVRDAANAINGTIITYGQTGAGKTYSMEGPGILECDEQKKGLLPRVVKELFDSINLSEEDMTYSIKLSMVEIYMEKVRDLFDLSKDNLQINESKSRGIFLPGVTEVSCFSKNFISQFIIITLAFRSYFAVYN